MARDSHSVWLNSAALARANGDLQVPGGVVELDERGEPTGVLREESCWHFRDRYIETTDDEYVEAMRAGVQARGLARRDRRARQGRLARRAPLLAAARGGGLALPAGLAVAAHRLRRTSSPRSTCAAASAARSCSVGYLKAFMDGTLGSETARMLDGSGVEITSREAVRGVHPRRRRAPASRSPSTRSATWPTARRSTPSRRRATSGSRSACASGSSTRSCSRPRTSRASRELGIAASVQFSHAPSDRDLADRFWGELDERAVRLPLAARLGRRARERLRRADRGARPAARHPRRRARGRSTSARRGTPSRR